MADELKGTQQADGTIILSPEEYRDILEDVTRIQTENAVLKQSGVKPSGSELSETERLAEEARVQAAGTTPDLERMSRSQLASYMATQIHEGAIQPLQVAIEQIRLDAEIDRLTRVKGYEDFWDHKDAIGKVIQTHPTLSMKDAYIMATGKTPDAANTPVKTGEITPVDSLTRFREKGTIISLKPGASSNTVVGGEPASRAEAAAKAFEVVIEGKTEG